jgi:hypothetical protein
MLVIGIQPLVIGYHIGYLAALPVAFQEYVCGGLYLLV